MHRFYLPDLAAGAVALTLRGSEAAHAAQVLRVREGEEVTVLNGRGATALAVVQTISRAEVNLNVVRFEQVTPPALELTLFQSLTKPKSMEWVVQKATELGIHTLKPILTERVVSQVGEEGASKKVEKWQRITVESLKQCGQPWLPRIEAPAALDTLLGSAPCSFVASLQPDARPLRDWLAAEPELFQRQTPTRIGLWIGPEGDFTEHEINNLLTAGARPITLGTSVLRSETAAVCGLALLHYELSLLRGNPANPPA